MALCIDSCACILLFVFRFSGLSWKKKDKITFGRPMDRRLSGIRHAACHSSTSAKAQGGRELAAGCSLCLEYDELFYQERDVSNGLKEGKAIH